MRVLGDDPATGLPVTLRDGRFGPFVQLGEASAEKGAEKPKRSSLPKGMTPGSVTLEIALRLLSLPREVAKHPETGEPILANLGRFGPYVQHGKTYANLGKDDDVLEIGANRAIDLIVAKEQGGGRGRPSSDPGRTLGQHPDGAALVVKAGKYGPYVSDGSVNATLPKTMAAESLTLEQAIDLVNAKRASGGGKKPVRKTASRARAPAKKAEAGEAKKPAVRKTAAKAKAPATKAAAKPAAAKKATAKTKAG
ncbi:UNVERIFIED_ORG: topoisomerase IA-like protein [Methylobacterium sp. SuP10 SLI 274]|nr:topoisomerase IA-like protein [Methylobacterium sp. SuP10 SLI 274]